MVIISFDDHHSPGTAPLHRYGSGMARKARSKKSQMLAKDFGKRLKQLREQRFLSQRALAKGIGVEAAHISRYERGLVLPGAETLVDLSQFLKVSLGTLLLGVEDGAGHGAEEPIQDISLLERFRELEKLERKDREIVIALIDAWVDSRQVERILSRRRSA